MIDVLLLVLINSGFMFLLVAWMGNRLVFYPSPHPEGFWDPPELASSFHDVTFPSEDDLFLHGWWCPDETDKTLLWMHGNSGNITHRLGMLNELRNHVNVQILLFDYRGYGKSDGRPNEEGLYKDAAAAYRFVTEEKGVDPDDVFFFGRSLGGAVAVELATHVECGGMILQSTFTNIKDMAGASVPIPLLHLVLRTRMDSLSRIENVQAPLLFFHGDQDEIVPISLGRRLYEHAQPPKKWVSIEGACHDDLIETDRKTYTSAFQEFLHA